MIARFATLLLLALAVGNAGAASFDCAKASSYSEIEICRDGYLSKLDSMLATEYRNTQQVSRDQVALRDSQRQWIAERDQCASQTCLNQKMSDRIYALQVYAQTEREQIQAAEFQHQQAELIAAEEVRQQEAARQAQLRAQQQAEAAARQAASEAQRVPTAPTQYQVPSTGYTSQPTAQPVEVRSKTLWDRFIEGPAWKYTLVVLIVLVLIAIALHRKEEMTVYIDYTDAAVTNVLPLVGLVAYGLLSWLEVPSPAPKIVFIAAVVLAGLFTAYTAYIANDAGWKVLLSFIAKVSLVSVFYLLMAILFASMLSTKYKDETRAQAEARNRRAHRAASVQIGLLASGYTFLTHWLCRYGEFSSLSDCLAYEHDEVEAKM
jgi:uncharacterized protein